MKIRVTLTGPPRVVLRRAAVGLFLPGRDCTLEEMLAALAEAEPSVARYLWDDTGSLSPSLRPLLNDDLIEPGSRIPDGGIVTLLYAVAGGSVSG